MKGGGLRKKDILRTQSPKKYLGELSLFGGQKTNHSMKRHVIFFYSFMLFANLLVAQDNFDVNFQTTPDFINVCGDADQEVVTVSLTTNSTEIRSNISVTTHFFEGIELVNFDASGSTAGVNLIDASDPKNPIFSLPDMDPLGLNEVNLSLEVRSDCGYIDTLQSGSGIFDVVDEWEFDYDLTSQSGLNESALTELYRDALAFPIFNLDVNNTFGPAKLNDCFSREITLQNSGLAGFVDSVFYENTQGAGVYVQAIYVNGVAITFDKVLTGTDTLISFGLGASEFMSIAGGDGDQFLDPDEIVVITEDVCLLDCLGDRASDHDISWGCGGVFCETVTAVDFIAVGQGAADVQVYENGVIADVDAGYCQTGNKTLVFSNEGIEIDAGFATMLDVSAGISLNYVGTSGQMSHGGFDITEMYIGTVQIPVPAYLIDLDNNPLFLNVDPDGPGGLSDFDGDGYFDDLELNESFEVTVYYEFDCTSAAGTDDYCRNDVGTNFSGLVNFTNLCGDRLERFNINYSSTENKWTEDVFTTSTDASMLSDTVFLNLEEKRKVSSFSRTCGDGEEYRISVVLPQGFNLLPGATTFLLGDGLTPLAMTSNVVSNDTLYLTFDASPTGVTGIPLLHRISLAFQADCSAIVGPTSFPFQWSHYCPSCDCEHVWHCEEFIGPYIHTGPSCPPLVCPFGVQTTSFEVERTTFGFTDRNYTTPFSTPVTNAGISCDSVEMTISNLVGNTNLTDSIGMVITYNNPDASISPIETFLFANGNLEIIQGAGTFNCSVQASQLTVTSVDSIKTLNFDLNSCLVDNGITLMPGDEINFVGKFTINPDAPSTISNFESVKNLRGYGYALEAGVEYACDNYGDDFTVGIFRIQTAYPNVQTQIRGCQEVALNVQISSQLNEYTDVFGFEHRPVIMVDSLVIDYDPTILESFGQLEPSLVMLGHPIFGDNPMPMPPVDNGTPGRYIINLDTLAWGPSMVDGAAAAPFIFTIRAIPNCQTSFGNQIGSNNYSFNPGLHFYDYAYALSYGDGSCSNYIEESTSGQEIRYIDPPEMNFIPVTTPTYTLLRDTAEFTVQYCNTTNDADIGASWLAIEDTLGNVELVSATDISLPGSPVDVPFMNYGSVGNNYVMFTEGLSRADGANGLEIVCNTILLKTIVTRCGTLDFLAKSGWDCLQPDAGWTPAEYDPCVDLELPLSIIVREPFIDADIEQEPSLTLDLCDANEVIIRVKNTQQGTLYDLRSSIILPTGINFVPGSFQIAYPHTAAFVNIATDPVANGSNSLGNIFTYNDFSQMESYLNDFGLSGEDALMPTDSNEFLLRFEIATDCDFIVNDRVYYSLTGSKSCGEDSNTESGETIPLTVNGLPNAADNSFDIDFVTGTSLMPNTSNTIGIEVENTNVNPTDADDFISIELPNYLVYEFGTSVGVQPIGWIPGEPVQELNGANTIYTWPMPLGLNQGEVAVLNFNVTTADIQCSLGSLDINLNTLVQSTVTCSTSAMNCVIETLTSSNNGATTNLNINQPTLAFNNVSYTSTCLDGVSESIEVIGSLLNGGDPVNAAIININFYFDNDGSGALEGTEPLIGSTSAAGPVLMGASTSFGFTSDILLSQLCGIIAQVDTTGLGVCDIAEIEIGSPQLINAGADDLFCATQPTTINTELGDAACNGLAGYTYTWTAIAPASTVNLSATDVANPTLTLPHDALVEDTLQFILTTDRPACGSNLSTSDTVSIIRGLGVVLNVVSPVSTSSGVPISIGANASFGTMPYTYNWTPAMGLNDPTIANPMATIFETTTFQVEVTSATGCSAIADVVVVIEDCIDPVVNSLVLTQSDCRFDNGKATINLAQNESGYEYTWTPDIGTANTIGNERSNLPVGSYSVFIESLGITGCESTIDFIISSYDGPQVDTVTTAATCNLSDGTATLSPAGLTYEWSDLGTGSTRNDLASGVYFVTVYDPADPDCKNVIEVIIDEVSNLQASVAINNHASGCTASDGSATISVTGGSGNYTYSWLSGSNTDANLSPGVYVVTVTDTDPTGCQTEVIFAIEGGTDLALISVNGTSDILCADQGNGAIDFNVSSDPNIFIPADTIITNGVDTFQNGMLPGGSYCMLILDNTGCIGASNCFDIIEPEHIQLVFTVSPPCPEDGAIELTILGGTKPFNIDWADISGNDDIEDRTGLDVGSYQVLVTDVNGCFVNEDEILLENCPTACDYFFGLETITEAAGDCQDVFSICLDIFSDEIDHYVVSDNGVVYDGNYLGCNNDTTLSYVYTAVILNLPPPYTVVNWDINGNSFSGDFADFQALTDSMNVWDPAGNWILEPTANSILGGAMSTNYGQLSIESQNGFSVPPLEPIETITPNSLALEIGTGLHTIIVTDTIGGCSDTLFTNISCPPYELQFDTLCVTESGSFTIDTSRLDLSGTVISSSNICGPNLLTDPVVFSYDATTLMVTYSAATVGIDSACIEFITDSGVRDTISFFITAQDCGAFYCDSVYILQTKEFCLDASELSGPITSITNICDDNINPVVDITYDISTGCVQYTGVELGQDTACIQYCDQFGICDTIYLCLETVPYFDPPVANDGPCDTTYSGKPLVIDFKADDILFGGIDTAYIIEPPLYGTIGMNGDNQLNPDCTATYTADEEICERYDEFTYMVCTPNGCDTSTVCIWIKCSDIIIFTAVSPNGDGVNDNFHIGGIEEYPDNELMIFNRWGNKVYQTEGYENDWNGRWQDDREVPDGTYFYILKLNDRENRTFNGYFELYR